MFLFYFSMIAHEQKQQEMFVLHVDNLTQFTRKLQIWRSDVIQQMNWIIYCPQIILSMSPRFINCSTHTKAVLNNLKLIFWTFFHIEAFDHSESRNQEELLPGCDWPVPDADVLPGLLLLMLVLSCKRCCAC